jgi:hypothetical protein
LTAPYLAARAGCEVTITFEMPATGQAYVNIHPDYGVKGDDRRKPGRRRAGSLRRGYQYVYGKKRDYDAFVNTAPAPDPGLRAYTGWTGDGTQYRSAHHDTCSGWRTRCALE